MKNFVVTFGIAGLAMGTLGVADRPSQAPGRVPPVVALATVATRAPATGTAPVAQLPAGRGIARAESVPLPAAASTPPTAMPVVPVSAPGTATPAGPGSAGPGVAPVAPPPVRGVPQPGRDRVPGPAPAVSDAQAPPAALPSVLELARAEVGGPEARYTTGWGFTPGFWCAKFASWLLAHAGIDVRAGGPVELKHELTPVTDPRPGDFVFIDLRWQANTGQTTHVGVVESLLPDGTYATIEGNGASKTTVERNIRRAEEITGFGRAPAPSSPTVIPAPQAEPCIWVELAKPWLCDA